MQEQSFTKLMGHHVIKKRRFCLGAYMYSSRLLAQIGHMTFNLRPRPELSHFLPHVPTITHASADTAVVARNGRGQRTCAKGEDGDPVEGTGRRPRPGQSRAGLVSTREERAPEGLVVQEVASPARREDDADRSRWDYCSTSHTLAIRMPVRRHGLMAQHVSDLVMGQIREMKSRYPAFVDSLDQLHDTRTTTRTLSSGTEAGAAFCERDPDGSFGCFGWENPGLVLEVLYSQSRRDVNYLEYDHLVMSNGATKCLVAVDIAYRGRAGRLLIFEREIHEENGALVLGTRMVFSEVCWHLLAGACSLTRAQDFRLADGSPAPAFETRIPVTHILPHDCDLPLPAEDLVFRSRELCSAMDRVEQWHDLAARPDRHGSTTAIKSNHQQLTAIDSN